MFTLLIIEGRDSGISFCLNRETTIIGFSVEADVTLNDDTIAGAHARITRKSNRYWLDDLDGSTGTFVNGRPTKGVPLEPGDEIRLGRTALRFTEGPPQPETGSPHSATDPNAAPSSPDPPQSADVAPELPPSVGKAPQPAPEAAEPDDSEADAESVKPSSHAEAPSVSRERGKPLSAGRLRIHIGNERFDVGLERRLLRHAVCPNCWHRFRPDQVLFVSSHPELIGDPVLGEDEYRRFAPKRFTLEGKPLDEMGQEAEELACPSCHICLPEAILEFPSIFASIIGPQTCGKSYLLGTMGRHLRSHTMPRLCLRLNDRDVRGNEPEREYESILFDSRPPDKPVSLPKTTRHDPRLHRWASIDGITKKFPVPFVFRVQPVRGHPCSHRRRQVERNLVLYDNAGEDFEPREQEAGSVATGHLAKADVLLFVVDPAQAPELQPVLASEDVAMAAGVPEGLRPHRPATMMNWVDECLHRILRLPEDRPIDKPLFVVLSKFDIMDRSVNVSIDDEPFIGGTLDEPARLDVGRVEETSDKLRSLLMVHYRELVTAAEGMCESVTYIPVSSLGRSPVRVRHEDGSTHYMIAPRDVASRWVTVPLTYYLAKWGPPGLVPTA